MRRGIGRRGPGLVGTVARTAVIAGTASAVAGGVSRRQEARYAPAEAPAPVPAAPAPEVAPSGGLGDAAIAQLTQLGELNKSGVLTDEEFAVAKAKILG